MSDNDKKKIRKDGDSSGWALRQELEGMCEKAFEEKLNLSGDNFIACHQLLTLYRAILEMDLTE